MRVVALLPAATEIVTALGAGRMLVGVSHACDYPPEIAGLPRVTRTDLDASLPSGEIDRRTADAKRSGVSSINVDVEALGRLRPDVLIGQSVCDVCAVGGAELERAAAALGLGARVVTLHAHDLGGVFADILKVGEALDLRDEAEELVAGLRYRLRRIRESRAGGATHHAPRTLVLEWLDPPYVAGHWVPELVEAAGGRDVGARRGLASAARPWAELAALAPDVVVVALCGFDVPRARAELAAVQDPRARGLLGRPVAFLDGNAYTSRPGPRLVDAVEILAALIGG